MQNTKLLEAILEGQNTLHNDIKRLETKIDRIDKRVDPIGKQVAFLEDYAPTREEFDNLDERMKKVELVFKAS